MKRLIAAIVLLVLVLAVCISGSLIIEDCYNKISVMIEECEKEFESNSLAAAEKAKTIKKQWSDYETVLSIFINHRAIEDVGISVSRIVSYAETQSSGNFYSECAVTRMMLMNMLREQKISIHSIF